MGDNRIRASEMQLIQNEGAYWRDMMNWNCRDFAHDDWIRFQCSELCDWRYILRSDFVCFFGFPGKRSIQVLASEVEMSEMQ